VVTKAVRGQQPLDVLLVSGRRPAHLLDSLVAHNLLLNGEPLVEPALGRGGGLRFKW
jgi:hypothetical protein